ncbi:hypothetical protein TanjilG_28388 [Lupinus angustifolius]|uniref:FAS1 domain-containing protein n=2 Tax=Lupinus angustifolius TaxID=3871 RepID=A0A394DMI8_LUPAN|nr:hypothetical protein TanjilG_28388 [Lupinus angustifolius]
MASTLTTFSLFLLLSFSTVTSSFTSTTIFDAAEILSASGFETMAFNLELASQTLSRSHSLTIFAPTDFAFSQIPHLPLSLLRYHLLPHAFSLHSLTSLPFGASIPTLLPSHSLTVTTDHRHRHRHHIRLSINNVTVNPSPVYNDGTIVIFAIDNFFDPYFELPAKSVIRTETNAKSSSEIIADLAACLSARKNEMKWSFGETSSVMRSRGFSVMASFLDMQFLGNEDRPKLTLFAPIDEVMATHALNVSDYSSILRQHIVPCRIAWSDLVNLEDETLIWTYERGFTVSVTKSSNEMLLINGVAVIFPELYFSDWLVVHGVQDVLSVAKGAPDSPSQNVTVEHKDGKEFQLGEEINIPAQHYHFSVFH